MRIARILTRLNLGGPARQALASDPLLAQRGHAVRVFVGTAEPGEGDLFERFVARGIETVRIPGLRRGLHPARDLLARRRLAKELTRFRPHVLHTHASKAGALGRSALARSKALAATACVHTFHGHVLEGYFPPAVSRRLIAIERRLARTTDRILAVSHATAEDLLRLEVTAEDKLVVVPPGVELDELASIQRPRPSAGEPDALRALVGARPEDVLVGIVGRLAAVKEPLRAIGVFELLAARFPTLQLVFVGDGGERGALERRIASLGQLSERVHLIGAREEMAPVFRALDAVLLTSRSEGLPVSLIEAGAAGIPAVARSVGGVGEIVAHERTGFLGETDEELAYGLAGILENRGERLAMGERARLRVQRRHSAAALTDRLETLYRAVVAERSGAEAAP